MAVYDLSVQVRDQCTKAPIQGAQVYIFKSGEDVADTLQTGAPSPEESMRTDELGVAAAELWFNTYSGRGILLADRCKRRLKKIEVIVFAEGYHAAKRIQRIRSGEHRECDSDIPLRVPWVELLPIDDPWCQAASTQRADSHATAARNGSSTEERRGPLQRPSVGAT